MHQSEWRRERFGDFFDIRSGVGFKYDEYVESGIPLVKIDNVSHGFIKWENRSYLPESYVNDFPEIVLEEGDILLALNRPITRGQLKIARISASDLPAILYQRVGKIIALTQQTLPDFYYYLFDRLIFRFVSRKSIGSDQPFISITDLKKEPIPLPSVTEQKKIAQILSTWDQAITATERLLENSQQRKKGLMQQLLTGKKRLPGFEEEWTETTLGAIGKISSAGVDKKIVEGEKSARLLNYLDVFRREFIFNHELRHEVTAPERKIANCDVRKGDVFFTPSSETRDEVGIPAVAAEDMPGVVYSYHVVRFRPSRPLDLNFSAFAFQTDEFRSQAYRLCDGSGQRYVLSQDNFRNIRVKIPCLEEQKAIGQILKASSDEISALRSRINLLKFEKKALMQQLLTGKRRVQVDTEAA